MIYIYSQQNTPRLTYIVSHLFQNILGTGFCITDDKEYFLQQSGICINYSPDNVGKGIQIVPHQLLFESTVHPITSPSPGKWKQLFCFFCNEKGDIPFDLFAASFYLISRYEEYFPKKLDIHLRYDPKESILWKNNCLEVPLVDQWTCQLKELFGEKGFDISDFELRKYNVISTFDIDHPFAFRNKGLLINAYGAIRDLIKLRFGESWTRIKTLLHLQEDPYFKVLVWIDQFHQQMNRGYFLFVLHGKYEKYGKKTIYPQRSYHRFLRSLSAGVKIGLHPSYSASFDEKRIGREKRQLEQLLDREITSGRQHFLRLQIPDTYRQLSSLGFSEDFTLMYSGVPGFRAGTAVPFLFFDLEQDCCTTLLIRPTAVMDTTLMNRTYFNPETALNKINEIAETCRATGGDFVMLWHNSNLANLSGENPWVKVFTESYIYAISLEK